VKVSQAVEGIGVSEAFRKVAEPARQGRGIYWPSILKATNKIEVLPCFTRRKAPFRLCAFMSLERIYYHRGNVYGPPTFLASSLFCVGKAWPISSHPCFDVSMLQAAAGRELIEGKPQATAQVVEARRNPA